MEGKSLEVDDNQSICRDGLTVVVSNVDPNRIIQAPTTRSHEVSVRFLTSILQHDHTYVLGTEKL